jgi:hypothetical protein
VPFNPTSALRGPKHVVKTDETPVLDGKEWRQLIDATPTETVRDLRDRAPIATLTYSFARITAALTMRVEDLRPRGAGWMIRLHEKGERDTPPCRSKFWSLVGTMPCGNGIDWRTGRMRRCSAPAFGCLPRELPPRENEGRAALGWRAFYPNPTTVVLNLLFDD